MRARRRGRWTAVLFTLIAGVGASVASATPAFASTVSGLSVTPSSTAASATGVRYDIKFTVANGLNAGSDTITITGPTGTAFANRAGDYDVRNLITNSGFVAVTTVATGAASVTITVPVNSAGSDVYEVRAYDVTNGSATGNLSVATSKDTTPASVSLSLVAPQAPAAVNISASSTAAGATAVRYTVSFQPSSSGGLSDYHTVGSADEGSSSVTLTGPTGAVFPTDPGFYTFQDLTAGTPKQTLCSCFHDPAPVVVTNSGGTVTLGLPSGLTTSGIIPAGDVLVVSAYGVTNGSTPGGTTTVHTSSDTTPSGGGATLVPMQALSNVGQSLSDSTPSATNVEYTLTFQTSSSGGLSGDNPVNNAREGSATITVEAPPGTTFPSDSAKYTVQDVTAGTAAASLCVACASAPPVTLSDAGATVTIGVPDGVTPAGVITSGDAVKVVVSGVTNPSTFGALTYSTSSDTGSSAKAQTATALASSLNPSQGGQSVTLTATVAPTPDSGTVGFDDGGTAVSGCSAVSVNTTTGEANCQHTFGAEGTHSITATYSGDAAFAGSVSTPLTQTVNPPPPPTAVADAYATRVSTTLNVPAPGLLGNDTGPTGDTLTAVVVTTVSHGALSVNSDGSVTYLPTTGYVGTDSFTYKDTDTTSGESSGAVAVTIIVDATAPTTTVTSQTRPVELTSNVAFCYTATDAQSGVASFDVRYRMSNWNGGFGDYHYPAGWQHTGHTCESLSVTPGHEYCFSARSRNQAHEVSPWTRPWCRTTPVDDRSLSRVTSGWTGDTGQRYYRHTVTKTSTSGKELKLRGARLHRLALVATRCPRCGSVDVIINGVHHVISTAASSTHYRALIFLPTIKTQVVTIVIRTTTGRPLYVDGLVVIQA